MNNQEREKQNKNATTYTQVTAETVTSLRAGKERSFGCTMASTSMQDTRHGDSDSDGAVVAAANNGSIF